jgi:hypothetical protein
LLLQWRKLRQAVAKLERPAGGERRHLNQPGFREECFMSKWILTALLACGLGLFTAPTNAADDAAKADKASGKSYTGILVDNHCGDRLKTAKAAARHPQTCLKKEECAKTGFQVIVGDKHLKFDEKGNELAKEFVASDDFTTRVVVTGTAGDDGKTIQVTSIKAVPQEKDEKEKQDEKPAKADTAEKGEKAKQGGKTEKAPKAEK